MSSPAGNSAKYQTGKPKAISQIQPKGSIKAEQQGFLTGGRARGQANAPVWGALV